MLRQEVRRKEEERYTVKTLKAFRREPCGTSPPGKVNRPPEASVAWE